MIARRDRPDACADRQGTEGTDGTEGTEDIEGIEGTEDIEGIEANHGNARADGRPILDRRTFLAAIGGACLLVACRARSRDGADALAPSAFVQVGSDERVTIWVAKSEMGQGVRAALAALVAEELDVAWSDVDVEAADLDPRYGEQETGGSASVRTGWEPLRQAGAAARHVLVAAAAARWGVPAASCRTERGVVIHAASGRRASYGQLASAAAKLPIPDHIPVKKPEDFVLIGTPLARIDAPDLVTGAARYGIDVRRPGMLHASIERCPALAGALARIDDAAARAVPGVRDVVPLSSGVAVVADSTWAALSGRRALRLTWRTADAERWDSPAIRRQLRADAERTGIVAEHRGDLAPATRAPELEAIYEVPFVAHAAMEPLACTADVRPGRCEIWAPTQKPRAVHAAAQRILGLAPDQIRVHVTLLGGGFGRRLESDFAIEAIELSRRLGAPVQVVWTREDDLAHDFYRPASLHRMTARLGAAWEWTHRVVAPSVILQRWAELGGELGSWVRADGLDETTVLGAVELPYDIPHVRIEYVASSTPVPIGWWRGTYDSLNAFANECFLDEIAATLGEDPYQLRRRLLHRSPRQRAVLDLAATRAGWGTPLPPGHARGLALHTTFGVPVAHVVELSVSAAAGIRVDRVVAAVDCGTVINPSGATAQIEGAIADGLTTALKAQITIAGGRVVERSLHQYALLRFTEMPRVEVHFLGGGGPPLGLGEPGVPPVAPAVANALFAATGRRILRLPLRLDDPPGVPA